MSPETPDFTGTEPESSPELDLVAPASTAPPARPASPGPAPAAAPARGPGRFEPLNLARRPFLNTRPVVRASLLLWALGLLLLLGNVSRFVSFRESSADKRAQIDRGEVEIMRQKQVAQRLLAQLDSVNLAQENERVDFLNHKIQERTFSWSALLDRIAERMPNDVRLNRLTPVTGEKTEKELQRSLATGRRSGAADQVPLLITGQARNSEALETFTQRLYQPPFDYPNPARTEVQEDGLIKFELSVQYRPRPPAAGAPAGSATPAPKIEELPMPGAAGSTATAAPPPGSARPAPAPPGGRP
jgi:hypothetical protein